MGIAPRAPPGKPHRLRNPSTTFKRETQAEAEAEREAETVRACVWVYATETITYARVKRQHKWRRVDEEYLQAVQETVHTP